MSYSLNQLRKVTDEQLINAHDEQAKHTSVGIQYYLDELDRRSRQRHETAIYRLSIISAVASLAAVITSIIALTN